MVASSITDTVAGVWPTVTGARVALTVTEWKLLECFLRHKGQALTRQQILDAVWSFDSEVQVKMVDIYVSYLRRALNGNGAQDVIEAVRGVSFRVPKGTTVALVGESGSGKTTVGLTLMRLHDASGGQVLFEARTKYESGSGWPSFWEPVAGAVETRVDRSLFMRRIEVHCRRCGGHLGHVFPDGPRETTGMRYCINSVSLAFEGKD